MNESLFHLMLQDIKHMRGMLAWQNTTKKEGKGREEGKKKEAKVAPPRLFSPTPSWSTLVP